MGMVLFEESGRLLSVPFFIFLILQFLIFKAKKKENRGEKHSLIPLNSRTTQLRDSDLISQAYFQPPIFCI